MAEDKKEITLEISEGMAHIEYRMPAALSLDSIEDLLPRWRKFKQQFQIFLTAAGFERLSETRKAALLLNCIGVEAQDLYINILKKDEGTQKYDQVLKAFDDYFTPKQNEVINTFNFNNRNQEEGESFDNFYSNIKKLVKNCNFKDFEDRMLRDRIVMGIKDRNLQQKLLEISDLTLDKAVNRCRAAELSREHVKIIQKLDESPLSVDTITNHQARNTTKLEAKYNNNFNNNRQFSNNNFSKNYYHCLKCNREHGPRQCPAYGKTCAKCLKLNHFASGCRNKKVQDLEKIDHIDIEDNNLVQDL